MYLTFDLALPIRQMWIQRTAYKRRFLRTYPTTTVDGIEVFDKCIFWHKNHGVYDQPEIYKLFGTSKEELEDQTKDFKGLEYVFFKVNPWMPQIELTRNQWADYFDDNVQIGEVKHTWFSFSSISTSHAVDYGSGYEAEYQEATLTNDELLTMLRSGFKEIIQGSLITGDPVDKTTFIALADSNEYFVKRTFRVVNRRVEHLDFGDQRLYKYGKAVSPSQTFLTEDDLYYATNKVFITVEMSYEKIDNAGNFTDKKPFDDIMDRMNEINGWLDHSKINGWHLYDYLVGMHMAMPYPMHNLIVKQMLDVADKINPLSTNALFYIKRCEDYNDPPAWIPPYEDECQDQKFLKVEAARNLSAKDFVEMVHKGFDTGYVKEKPKGWEKALSVLINIVTFVVAFLTAPMTGGGSFSVFAAITSFTAVLATGVLVQYLFSLYLEKIGHYAGAFFTRHMLTVLSSVSRILGYVTFALQISSTLISGFTRTVIVNGIVKTVRMTSSQIFNTVTSWLDTGFSWYSNNSLSNQREEIKSKQEELDAQREEMIDHTSPKQMQMVQQYFENYEWAEVNQVLDNIPYVMTEFKIENATGKYY